MDHLFSPASTPCALCLHSCRRPQLLVAKITCNFCCASALDDSQITQENRETAETELVEGEKGLLLPSSSFSRRRSTGLDLCSIKVADMISIPVFIPDPEWRMWRQLIFVMAAAVFGWALVSGEELDDANKKGRSKFRNLRKFST